MNLINSDVNVQVIGVFMHRRNAVMICKADSGAKLVLNFMQNFGRRVLAGRKRKNKVICFIKFRSSINRLRRLN